MGESLNAVPGGSGAMGASAAMSPYVRCRSFLSRANEGMNLMCVDATDSDGVEAAIKMGFTVDLCEEYIQSVRLLLRSRSSFWFEESM